VLTFSQGLTWLETKLRPDDSMRLRQRQPGNKLDAEAYSSVRSLFWNEMVGDAKSADPSRIYKYTI